ncbi:hypothetical protein PENSUB_4840 [Penicillium subrubescens]|uniref:Uncharacterized protein n=1 Tax=Penicillium subrubescens TaxID=1316194 RepID=A0A1Q5UBD2_9EURO|nr:hypothetical protein PENSUB_4840 [Penicillium subrubescens]
MLIQETYRTSGGSWTIPLSEDGSKPSAQLQHFFDGLGVLHKFEFNDGEVKYISRSTADGLIRKAKEQGFLKALVFGLNPNTALEDAQDPCWAKFGKQACLSPVQSIFLPSNESAEPDEYNVNVVPRRGFHVAANGNPNNRGKPAAKPEEEEIIIGSDVNVLQICDAKTLEPKRLFTWAAIDPELNGFGICAHPVKDRQRHHIYNYLISEQGVMYVFAVDYASNPAKLGTGFKNVHVDLISYDGASCPFLEFNFSNLLSPGGPFTDGTLIRYELSGVNALPKFSETQRRATVAQMMPNCPIELPRINKFYSCNPSYRYVWGIIESGGTAPGTLVPLAKLSNGISHPSCAFSAGIAKADWQTGKVEIWRPENGESAPCEPVFIGRPGASDEDDGITLTIVVNREGSHSTLVALDGKTLAEVARASMPQVYGMGPHGSFIEKPGLYSQADMNP